MTLQAYLKSGITKPIQDGKYSPVVEHGTYSRFYKQFHDLNQYFYTVSSKNAWSIPHFYYSIYY